MKILSVSSLVIPEVKVVRFGRFADHRGYFTEHFRQSDFKTHPELAFLREAEFVQCNESLSKAGTLRGLHFQWNPYVGKLVRAVAGRVVELLRAHAAVLAELESIGQLIEQTAGDKRDAAKAKKPAKPKKTK